MLSTLFGKFVKTTIINNWNWIIWLLINESKIHRCNHLVSYAVAIAYTIVNNICDWLSLPHWSFRWLTDCLHSGNKCKAIPANLFFFDTIFIAADARRQIETWTCFRFQMKFVFFILIWFCFFFKNKIKFGTYQLMCGGYVCLIRATVLKLILLRMYTDFGVWFHLVTVFLIFILITCDFVVNLIWLIVFLLLTISFT